MVMPPRGRGRPPRTEVYQRLALAMDDMQCRFGGLPSRLEAESLWRDIWREDAHNSTAIEGNTLVQREVNRLLEEGIAGGGRKALSEYLVVQGYGNAASWVYFTGIDPAGDWSTGALLSMYEIRYVHQLTMDLAWQVEPHEHAGPDEGAGAFRKHELEPLASGITPVSHPLVASEMAQWLEDVQKLRDAQPYPVLAIAELHAKFERIHPFIDGNGRTGRLLLNLLLVRLGMPPAIIYKRDRDRYLTALKRADLGDPGAMAELVSRAVLHNLERLMLPKLAGTARSVPISALASENASHGALRSAAARGALKATQDSLGQWHSSRDHVDEYMAQRNSQRGRPRLV